MEEELQGLAALTAGKLHVCGTRTGLSGCPVILSLDAHKELAVKAVSLKYFLTAKGAQCELRFFSLLIFSLLIRRANPSNIFFLLGATTPRKAALVIDVINQFKGKKTQPFFLTKFKSLVKLWMYSLCGLNDLKRFTPN